MYSTDLLFFFLAFHHPRILELPCGLVDHRLPNRLTIGVIFFEADIRRGRRRGGEEVKEGRGGGGRGGESLTAAGESLTAALVARGKKMCI